MDLEELIKDIEENLEDVKEHKAVLCYFENEKVEDIIEY